MHDPANSAAVMSPCGVYRYRLTRYVDVLPVWEDKGLRCVFVALNPSTADASKNDPTLRRMIQFSAAVNCNRLDVVNLFAFRATDPRDLRSAPDPVGPDNDQHIAEAVSMADVVIVAWGPNGSFLGRDRHVLGLLKQAGIAPQALRITSGGHPSHPLYLPACLRPIPFGRE